jgi:hypothetical protein
LKDGRKTSAAKKLDPPSGAPSHYASVTGSTFRHCVGWRRSCSLWLLALTACGTPAGDAWVEEAEGSPDQRSSWEGTLRETVVDPLDGPSRVETYLELEGGA